MKTSNNNKQKDSSPSKGATILSASKSLSASFYCEEGQIQLNDGKLLQALEYFQAAIDIDDENIEALHGLVTTYESLGKINKAEQTKQKLNTIIKTGISSEAKTSSPVRKKNRNSSNKTITNNNDNYRTTIGNSSEKQKESKKDTTMTTVWTLVIVVFIVFIVLLIAFPDFIFGLLLIGGFIAWSLSSSK